jgi:membrane protein implicated in regulation of membrane protease activity
MSRYRNRVLKATAAMWLLVLLADAGWVATSRAALTAATVLAVCVVLSAALFYKFMQNLREDEAVPVQVREGSPRRGTP